MKRLVVLVATFMCLLAPTAAYAYNPLSQACGSGGGVDTHSPACSTDASKDPITGPNGVLKKVSLLLGVLGGIVAVIMIIVSGFRYISAAGDPQKTNSARDGIVGSVVGLVIIAASTSIVVFVVSRL